MYDDNDNNVTHDAWENLDLPLRPFSFLSVYLCALNMDTTSILSLDFAISDQDFQAGAKKILKIIRPSWSEENLRFKIFTDGITNKLIGCCHDGDREGMVLVRINGEGTDIIINRQEEQSTFCVLYNAGCAPPIFCLFRNGMAYGFYPGVPLDEASVREPKVQRLIAEQMVHLHKVRGSFADTVQGPTPSQYRERTQSYLNFAPTSFDDPKKQALFVEKIPSKAKLQKELNLIVENLEALGMENVLSHNDLLLKNIIFNEKKGSAHFIDYEYAFYNYEAFDIGNHFAEYAGMDEVDYNLYPAKSEQLPWLRHYLDSKAKVGGKSSDSVTEKDVERLYVQTNKCTCAAHFFWGVWSLIQAEHSSIDFDYVSYSDIRLSEYFRRKEEFFPLRLPD